MAALRNKLWRLKQNGNLERCLLKLTGQNCCPSLVLMPWNSSGMQLQFTWIWNWGTICEVSSRNHAMCLQLEIATILEIVTFKFSWMETFCPMEVELSWLGLWNGAVEGQLLFKERHQWSLVMSIEKGCEGRRHVSKLYIKTLFTSEDFHF